VQYEERVVEGQAGNVLLEESRGAAMLVVGSRGHGAFRELLLGSVSRQVVQHARCPVVVVPVAQG
jgi:nucleotide-binding universal stress UspA family protein